MASPQGTAPQGTAPRGTPRAAARPAQGADAGARNELVDFIVHRAFYPVLMADRAGPRRAMIEHVQAAARAEIDRFRSYGSAEEVICGFKRDLASKPAQDIHSELKLLSLPVIDDLRDDFERKARELGFEPDTLLRTFGSTSDGV